MTRSFSASSRQPTATKPLYRFDDYTTKDGRPALSVRIDVRDMAKLYAEHPDQAGEYEPNWCSTAGSKYVSRKVHNADDALDAIAAFQFPADIKAAANRAARELVSVFEQVSKLTVVHDLVSGRLDRRKLADVAQASANGTYDADKIRPYRRTLPTPSTPPTVVIAASAGNAEMWGDANYIPRILTLTLAVLWACEAAGLRTYAALTSGHCRLSPGQPVREAVQGVMLSTPDAPVSPRVYGIALHRDLWRHGHMTIQMADPASNRRFITLDGRKYGKHHYGYHFPSRDGGNAARWAREVLGADIVVGIGNIQDKADISLSADFGIDEAAREIAAQARKLAR